MKATSGARSEGLVCFMEFQSNFWQHLDQLVNEAELVIDRPKGSAHPRLPQITYPLDYGYLAGTTAIDGGGIDVWVGSKGAAAGPPQAIICTVDLFKQDAEIKILLGCTQADIETILSSVNTNSQAGMLVLRPEPPA